MLRGSFHNRTKLGDRRRLGFTLIELLVCISIIAIIAAILLPVFSFARAKVRTVACAHQLHQIGTALALYRSDYDDVFPSNPIPVGKKVPPGQCKKMGISYPPAQSRCDAAELLGTTNPGWIANPLADYEHTGTLYECPTRGDTGGYRNWRVPDGANSYSYNYGSLGGNDPNQPAITDAALPDASRLIVMLDSGNDWLESPYMDKDNLWGRDLCWFLMRVGRPRQKGMNCNPSDAMLTSWHQDRNNFLFVDGHVRTLSWDQITWDQVSRGAQENGNPDAGRPVLTPPLSPRTDYPWP